MYSTFDGMAVAVEETASTTGKTAPGERSPDGTRVLIAAALLAARHPSIGRDRANAGCRGRSTAPLRYPAFAMQINLERAEQWRRRVQRRNY